MEGSLNKVLFFANTDWYLYNFRLGLARFLRDLGIEVVMMSPPGKFGPRIQEADFRWLPLPMDRGSLNVLRESSLLCEILRVYRAERPDLVHNFTIKCVVYGSLAAQAVGIDARVNAVTGLGHVFISGSRKARFLRSAVKQLLRRALRGSRNRLILQNRDDRALFEAFGLVDPDHIRLIPSSGVNTERFSRVEREPGGRLRVLLASRLLWEKGVGEYVDAARRLRADAGAVEFLLAGAPDTGNPSCVSDETIAGWAAEGVVRVLGHVDDMAALMRKVDVVVLPSYREGAPRQLIEGAAAGLPVVAADVPGCRDVVEDGVTGFLVPAKDSKALSERIGYLLKHPEVRRRFGDAGREKVLNEFDERIVCQRTYAVYRELGLF
jgi:glycosyltransferase involved in cell wall biosynthesis